MTLRVQGERLAELHLSDEDHLMRRASVGHIRPMLIGVLTGILLMLAQPVHATCQTQRAVTSLSRLSSVPVVMTEDLGIDTQDVERQVTALDESTGAAELRTLARVSSYEEAWAYLPDAHLWVQTGTRQLIDP